MWMGGMGRRGFLGSVRACGGSISTSSGVCVCENVKGETV